MLPAAARLRRRDEFAATIKGGRRAARGGVVVHLRSRAPQNAQDPARVDVEISPSARAGFVVSKAVGGAVVRNKVRRQLRHLMRARLTSLPAGSDVVVRALPLAATRTYGDLELDLNNAIDAASRPRRTDR